MNPWLVWAVIPTAYLLREVIRELRGRWWRAELRRLQWREHFAMIRDEVVQLIVTDKLPPSSILAQTVYRGSSALVRHAHDYDGFAKSVLLGFLAKNVPDNKKSDQLYREFSAAQPEVRLLLTNYFHSMTRLACERSLMVRILFNHVKLPSPEKRRASTSPAHRTIRKIYRRNPLYRDFSETRAVARRVRQLDELIGQPAPC